MRKGPLNALNSVLMLFYVVALLSVHVVATMFLSMCFDLFFQQLLLSIHICTWYICLGLCFESASDSDVRYSFVIFGMWASVSVASDHCVKLSGKRERSITSPC